MQLYQLLTDFQNFCTAGKRIKFATKPIRQYPRLTLGMLLHYLGKLKIQIFSRYSAHIEENANKWHFYRLYLCYSSTNFDISVFKIASFPILIANKIFHVTVLLLVCFCDHDHLWHWKFVTAVFVNNQHGIQ